MFDAEGVPVSIVYFDGDTESNLGQFTVDASFNFNKLLSFLSHKIGMSPHHFSVHLATSNRKIPITAKVNVAAIVSGDSATAASCFFYVRRSRRPKRNRTRNKGSRGANDSINHNISSPANVVLLRRNNVVPFSGAAVPILSRVEYEKRLMELQMEKERFMLKMATGGGAACKQCSAGMDSGFHWCVYDAVTVGFRSPAGPVARPVRGSG
ncbi:hypothetical protein PIB30_002628 [Stylosanthes scabra]|uniref:DUF7138 domain-containing protein n=1 Tax=Stylosanthes scabra TaxID=79078 RepID=A0ABU6Q2W6_9FABA|nr:hypothetical protein [Stylosanthes scabra]